MGGEVPAEGNGSTAELRDGRFLLSPVSPYAYGEGLPYAPVDWPNLGDVWKWRVGSRISRSGYYFDTYLYPPSHFPKPGAKTRCFGSKPSLEQYIRKEFPGADVDAFFNSFSLKVPSKRHDWTKGQSAANGSKAEKEIGEEKEKSPRKREEKEKNSRKRNQSAAELSPTCKRHTRLSRKRILSCSPNHEGQPIDLTMEEASPSDLIGDDQTGDIKSEVRELYEDFHAEVTREDFDEYLKSVDGILTPPPNSAPTLEELDGARSKLSSLLSMDFPSLIASDHLPELPALCLKLLKVPSLSADQASKLRLVVEIPLASKCFLEVRETIEQADEFLENFKGKSTQVASLRNEYNTSKEKESILKAEMGLDSSAVEGIDNQISQLQSRRAEVLASLEKKRRAVDEMAEVQERVAKTLPPMVREIQMASTKKMEWETKKQERTLLMTEILSKFAPLKGFSL